VIVDKGFKSGRAQVGTESMWCAFCGRNVTLYREEQDVMPLGKQDLLITRCPYFHFHRRFD
jgi:hypothetical protein